MKIKDIVALADQQLGIHSMACPDLRELQNLALAVMIMSTSFQLNEELDLAKMASEWRQANED